jgi:hypothetical protein
MASPRTTHTRQLVVRLTVDTSNMRAQLVALREALDTAIAALAPFDSVTVAADDETLRATEGVALSDSTPRRATLHLDTQRGNGYVSETAPDEHRHQYVGGYCSICGRLASMDATR